MEDHPYDPTWKLISIALAGVSGKRENSSFQAPSRRLSSYFGDLCEGGIVIDKRPCPENVIIRQAYCGAMVQVEMPDNTVSRMGGNGLEPCDDAEKAGSMDFIALNLYVNQWRKLGARIGVRRGRTIHWENGEKSPIPAFKDRYAMMKDPWLTEDE
jgi:hypothetical protein